MMNPNSSEKKPQVNGEANAPSDVPLSPSLPPSLPPTVPPSAAPPAPLSASPAPPPRPALVDASGQGRFVTTQWSVVLAAATASSTTARRALAVLCEKYWPPLYNFIRRQGYSPEDAQDLTQGFFASLLSSESLKNVGPDRGRFRSFLLASMKHYLSSERKRSRAQKRGGGQLPFSLDFSREEDQLRIEPADPLTPERIYERRWVLALLDSTLARMAEEARERGEAETFKRLRPYLTREEPLAPYAEVAAVLGSTEGAVKVAVHRLRKRFAELLRAEIAETLSNSETIDEEIQYLFTLF